MWAITFLLSLLFHFIRDVGAARSSVFGLCAVTSFCGWCFAFVACNVNRTVAQITDREKQERGQATETIWGSVLILLWRSALKRRKLVLWSGLNWLKEALLSFRWLSYFCSLLSVAVCVCSRSRRVNWMTKLTTGKISRILKINDAIIGFVQIIRLPCQIIFERSDRETNK